MLNEQYRLQLLSHGEIFPTREEAVEYINDNFKNVALWSEPALFFYGSEREPKMIIAVGATVNSTRPRLCFIDEDEIRETLAEWEEQIGVWSKVKADLMSTIAATGLTYDDNKIENRVTYEPDSHDALISDATSVAEAIALISEYAQSKVKEINMDITDTASVNLTKTVTADGSMLTADVNISSMGSNDDLTYNDNIIGIENDGLYAAANLEYDDARNQLIFTASGRDSENRFKPDANKKIINLPTPQAEVNINGMTTDTSITQATEGVDGQWVVSNDVRLSSDNSLIVSNGGLKVDLDIDVDESTNTMTVRLGNSVQSFTLPGINIIDKIDYDAQNKNIVITVHGQTEPIIIPVNDIVETWTIDNPVSSPVELHRDASQTGIDDKVYATLKLRSNDNLIEVDPETGNMFVSASSVAHDIEELEEQVEQNTTDIATNRTEISALTRNLNTVSAHLDTEIARAQAAEGVLTSSVASANTAIESEVARAQGVESNLVRMFEGVPAMIDDKVAVVSANLTAETQRAQASEANIVGQINSMATTLRAEDAAKLTEAKAYTDTQVNAEKDRAMGVEGGHNVRISALETSMTSVLETLPGKVSDVRLVKNAQNDLQYFLYVDNVMTGEIDIPKDQFIRSVSYDDGNKALVFVFETTSGTETVTVSVADLVDTYTAGDGLQLNGNKFSVKLNEDTESYLQLTAEGLKVAGIDAALLLKADRSQVYSVNETDALIDGVQADIETESNRIDALTSRVETTESEISTLTGNYATAGSVANALYQAKEYTDNSVNAEKQLRIEADEDILHAMTNKANVSDVYTKAEIDAKGYLQPSDVSTVYATKSELTDAVADLSEVDGEQQTAIENAQGDIARLTTSDAELYAITRRQNLTVADTGTVDLTYVTSVDGSTLEADVKIDTMAANNSLTTSGNGLRSIVDLSYNSATNQLTLTSGLNTKQITLSDHTIVTDGFYDSTNQQIVLLVTEGGISKRIEIPVADLVKQIQVDNTDNDPVNLALNISDEGVPVLSASVSISNADSNGIINNNGTLYASKMAHDLLTAYDGGVGDPISVQDAILRLRTQTDRIDGLENNIDGLSDELDTQYQEIIGLSTDMRDVKERLDELEPVVEGHSDDIDELQSNYTTLSATVGVNSNAIATLNSSLSGLQNRVNIMEGHISDISRTMTSLATDVATMKAEIGQYDTTLGSIADRLAHIEFIVNNLIDFSDTNGDGTPDGF